MLRMLTTSPTARGLTGIRIQHDEAALLRHPVCTTMNMVVLLVATFIWVAVADQFTRGQHAYFAALVWLYGCSTVYHTLPRTHSWARVARFLDQTAIGWFIPATALPFVWGVSSEAVLALLILMATQPIFKWFDAMRRLASRRLLSLTFLIKGMAAGGLTLLYNEIGLASDPVFWIASSCFVLQLAIFHRNWLNLSRAWANAESYHAILAIGIVALTALVLRL